MTPAAFAPPIAAVRDAVRRALAEDIGPLGDLTATLLPTIPAGGAFVARQDGVLAGQACAAETFRQLDATVELELARDDGDRLRPGDRVAAIRGPLASILTGERTALNFICHLSGVASATRALVDAVAAANPH